MPHSSHCRLGYTDFLVWYHWSLNKTVLTQQICCLSLACYFFCTIADKICSRSQVVRQLGGMSAKRFSAQTCPKHLLGVRLFFQTQL